MNPKIVKLVLLIYNGSIYALRIVEEAIIKLESVGLVKNKAGSGWIVSKISSQEIIELYDLRKLLEVYSGKIGCLKCPKEIKNEIKNELNLMEKAKRVDTWRERNMRFHELIVLSCNNKKIYGVFMSTIKMLNWCSHVTEPVSLRKKESLIEHQSILDAFLLKDQELFEQKISLHIDNAKKKVIRYQK